MSDSSTGVFQLRSALVGDCSDAYGPFRASRDDAFRRCVCQQPLRGQCSRKPPSCFGIFLSLVNISIFWLICNTGSVSIEERYLDSTYNSVRPASLCPLGPPIALMNSRYANYGSWAKSCPLEAVDRWKQLLGPDCQPYEKPSRDVGRHLLVKQTFSPRNRPGERC
jgi:hypothetical protein